MNALTRYDEAKRALGQVRTAAQAKDIRDKAAALAAYAKAAMDNELACWAAEIRLRAERKLGAILMETEKSKGAAAKRGSKTEPRLPTLKDLGIDKKASMAVQKLARVPESKFEAYIKECLLAGDPPRSAWLLAGGGRRGKLAVHYSSKSAEHYTPPEVVALVQACFGGEIDLDPCSNSTSRPNVPAVNHYDKRDNGLVQPWSGNVYVNPPYGDEIVAWVEKCVTEYQEGRTSAIILLTPARTDTAWWHALRDFPVCFWRGRLQFVGNEDPAPFPSALFWLSEQPADIFAATFAEHGTTYIRYPQAGSA